MQPCYSCHGMFEPYLHLPYCVRDFIVFLCHCCRLNCRVACGWQSPRLNPPVLRLCPWLLICLLEWGSLCRSSSLPISFKALLSMQLVTWAPKQYFLLFALLSHNSCADLWSVSWSQNVPCSGLIDLLHPSSPFPSTLCPLPSCVLPQLTLYLSVDPCPQHLPSPNLFHPLDHVAMHPLAPTCPYLAVLYLLVLGRKLPSSLPVPRPSHCGLQRAWTDPSSQWDPFGCPSSFASWQLDPTHTLRLFGSVQWFGLPGPPEQLPVPHRTWNLKHFLQTGLPGLGQ